MGRNTWWRGGGRGRGRGGYSTRNRSGSNNNDTTIKKSSIGIELFTIQGARSVSTSNFEDVQLKLTQWVSAQTFPLASQGSKMIRTLQDVEIVEPTKPIKVTRESWDRVHAKQEDATPIAKKETADDIPDLSSAVESVAQADDVFDEHAANEDHETALERYRSAIKVFDKNVSQWEETNSKIFEIVRGQCSQEVSATIFADPSWLRIEEEYDTVAFLIAIRDACGRLNHLSEGKEVTCVHLDMNLMTCLQEKDEPLLQYYKRFDQAVHQNQMNGGSPGYHDAMYQRELAYAHEAHLRFSMIAIDNLMPDQLAALQEIAMATCTSKYLAILFIKLAHPARFGHVTATLNNSSLINRVSSWPTDLPAALDLLLNFEREKRQSTTNNNNNRGGGFRIPHTTDQSSVNNEGVAFMQTQGRRGPTCYFCLGDHIIRFCDHPNISQATCNAIYTHRTAGTFKLHPRALPGALPLLRLQEWGVVACLQEWGATARLQEWHKPMLTTTVVVVMIPPA